MSGVYAARIARAFDMKSKVRSIVLDHLLSADLKEQVERLGSVQPAFGGPAVGQIGRTDPAGYVGREVALEHVRRYRGNVRAVDSAAEPALAAG